MTTPKQPLFSRLMLVVAFVFLIVAIAALVIYLLGE